MHSRLDWSKGINNRATDVELASTPGYVEDVLDAHYTDDRSIVSRNDTTRKVSLSSGLGMAEFDGALVYGDAASLRVYYPQEDRVALLSAWIGAGVLVFAKTPLGLVWSSGYKIGVVRRGFSADTLAPHSPTVAVTFPQGNVELGRYKIAASGVSPSGVEGAISEVVYAEIYRTGQGLSVTVSNLDGLSSVVIYASDPNGSVLREAIRIPVSPGLPQFSVSNFMPAGGRVCDNEFAYSMPPGQCLAYRNGVLFCADNATLRASLPFNLGLTDPELMWQFGSNIRMLASADGGLYVATEDSHWFVTFSEDGTASRRHLGNFGAPWQTPAMGETGPVWMTDQHTVIGSGDGQLTMLSDRAVSVPKYQRSATIYTATSRSHLVISSCF